MLEILSNCESRCDSLCLPLPKPASLIRHTAVDSTSHCCCLASLANILWPPSLSNHFLFLCVFLHSPLHSPRRSDEEGFLCGIFSLSNSAFQAIGGPDHRTTILTNRHCCGSQTRIQLRLRWRLDDLGPLPSRHDPLQFEMV